MSTSLIVNGLSWSNGTKLLSNSDGTITASNSNNTPGTFLAKSFTLSDGQGSLYSDGAQMHLATDDLLYIDAAAEAIFSGSGYFAGALQINGYNTAWNGTNISNLYTSSDNSRFGYLQNSGTNGGIYTNTTPANDGTGNTVYGLVVRHRIGCGDEVDAFCDERIKQDINDINTMDALIKLRLIQPKTFNYIDKPKSKLHYGFIAQEVDRVFSDSVNKICNYIPNIYDLGVAIDKNTIILKNKTTKDFIITSGQKDFKIKIIINNKDVIVSLNSIIDEHTFTINDELEKITDNDKNYIIIYGQEVNDFHLLEKNAIFTLTTSAVKQLDKELQETKITIKLQQKKLEDQQKQIEDQQKKIEDQQKQINDLKELILSRLQ
jgi:hypothetical protein